MDGNDIYGKGVNVDELRKNVGMVFQKPNPFPKSIFGERGLRAARKRRPRQSLHPAARGKSRSRAQRSGTK